MDVFSIDYVADPAYSDNHLPLVHEMVESFKIGLESSS